MQTKKIFIRTAAGLMVSTGLYQMLRHGLHSYCNLFVMFAECAHAMGPLFIILCAVLMLTPILKLASAIGLLMSKRWGWIMAIAVLALDLLFGFRAAVIMASFAIHTQHSGAMVIPADGHDKVISMWPTYIIALVGAVLLLALIKEDITREFDTRAETA